MPSLRARFHGLAMSPLLVLCAAPMAQAQLPDKFTNLQVLPADIAKPQLIETMRGFALGLGVRCTHCHVGEEGVSFDRWDFASDAKPAKATARLMLQMTAALNEQWIARVKSERPAPTRVNCATCHHGKPVPNRLEDVLAAALAEGGSAAAIARYHELRQRYYGRDAYDFGEQPLSGLAETLAGRKQTADALAILDLAAVQHPESARVHGLRAATLEERGDKDAAIAAYRRVLELVPDDERAKRRLAVLQGASQK